MSEYRFDVKFFGTVDVTAASEDEAREKLSLMLMTIDCKVGEEGQAVDLSDDGEADLIEIDGNDPEETA